MVSKDQENLIYFYLQLNVATPVADINSYRTDSIERYQKGQEKELRIKQLEREADSLKALKNQSN